MDNIRMSDTDFDALVKAEEKSYGSGALLREAIRARAGEKASEGRERLEADLDEAKAEVQRLCLIETYAERMEANLISERDAERARTRVAEAEAQRLRCGEGVEGDFVCPHEFKAKELEAELKQERAYGFEMSADLERVRMDVGELERERDEAKAEAASCIDFLVTQMGWEWFWAEGWVQAAEEAKSQARKNAAAIRRFLDDKGHAKRYKERMTRVEAERDRVQLDGGLTGSKLAKLRSLREYAEVVMQERDAALARLKEVEAERDEAKSWGSRAQLHERCLAAEAEVERLRDLA